jgi:hypothetical protein
MPVIGCVVYNSVDLYHTPSDQTMAVMERDLTLLPHMPHTTADLLPVEPRNKTH